MSKTNQLVGKKTTKDGGRDAIHVAVIAVEAGETLAPAGNVGIVDGKGFHTQPYVGIVDPFLKTIINPGEWFWLFMNPNTVTDVKHEWEHPAFEKAKEENSIDKYIKLKKSVTVMGLLSAFTPDACCPEDLMDYVELTPEGKTEHQKYMSGSDMVDEDE